MSRDYKLYLEDMQISCRKLLRYAENLDSDLFASDEVIHDAVVYNLVVLARPQSRSLIISESAILRFSGARSQV